MTTMSATTTPQDVIDSGIVKQLAAIEVELNAVLIEREEAVRLCLVALLARQHTVLLGPPGTGKSFLIERLTKHLADASGGCEYFDILMTRFTTPEEVLGPVSVTAMKQDRYERLLDGYLATADIAFLDEVFKSNSAILNALLRIVNERTIVNGGRKQPVKLLSLFAASNEMPQSDDLQAFWDRLALRYVVGYLSEAGFARFLRMGTPPPPKTFLNLPDLFALQAAVEQVLIPDSLHTALETLRRDLLAEGIVVSDRRWGIALGLLRAHALIEGRVAAEEDDLAILAHVCWQQPDQAQKIRKAAGKLANPLNQKATEIGDEARSVYDATIAAQNGTGSDQDKMQAIVEALTKLKDQRKEMTRVYRQAEAEGRSLAKIEKIGGDIATWQMAITEMMTI